jgi:hypothetical protein
MTLEKGGTAGMTTVTRPKSGPASWIGNIQGWSWIITIVWMVIANIWGLMMGTFISLIIYSIPKGVYFLGNHE